MTDVLEQLEVKIHALVASIEQGRDLHTEDIKQLVDVREWKVAVEILCDLLLEEKRELSPQDSELLVEVATALEVDRKYWQSLVA
jgi:hypothetical protein